MDPRIDRLRGLLAIGVLVGHAIDLAQMSVPGASGTLFALALAARPFFGFICVLGFIVLSGYCIARSTLARFSLPQYAVKRATRIYPLLIAAVLLTALVEWAAFGSPHRPGMWVLGVEPRKFVVALLGFSGFKGPFGALAPAYTVSFELFYYAVWGLALAAVGGRSRPALLIAAASAIGLIVFGEPMRTALGWFGGFVSAVGIALFPGWLFGAALALFKDRVSAAAGVIPIWATWIVFVLVHAYCVDRWQLPFAFHVSELGYLAYCTVMSGVITVLVATWLARPVPATRAVDTWLGELSYPLFLVHGPVIIGLQFALNAWRVELPFAAALALLLAAPIAAAMIAMTYVERPVMAWRRSVRMPGAAPRSVAPVIATSPGPQAGRG